MNNKNQDNCKLKPIENDNKISRQFRDDNIKRLVKHPNRELLINKNDYINRNKRFIENEKHDVDSILKDLKTQEKKRIEAKKELRCLYALSLLLFFLLVIGVICTFFLVAFYC